MHSNITEIEEKTRQNAENKQTFGLTGEIDIEEKTRQNAEINNLLIRQGN